MTVFLLLTALAAQQLSFRDAAAVNAQLAAEAPSLAPGRALDIGCGEGGDAIWLASQGWAVTAVDFAEAALTRTAEHAREAGVGDRVDTRRVDVRSFEPAGETWDLVTSHFFHLPDGGMPDVVRRLAAGRSHRPAAGRR